MLDSTSLSVIFLACVDTGSFAAAGRRLNLSRSSVGKAIAKLEADLGVRLFQRTTRHQGLTEEGHIYLEHARRAQSELEAAREIFAAGKREPSGLLRAALPSSLGRHLCGPLLLELPRLYSDLQVSLSLSDRPIDLVQDGFDLAVRIGASLEATGIMQHKIGVQRMQLYAAPSYLCRFGEPCSVAELKHHQVIAYARERASRRQSPNAGGAPAQPGASALQIDDLDLIAATALQGRGIASLPQWLADPYVATGALRALSAMQPRSFDIVALWPQSEIVPLRVRAAIDHLARHLPSTKSSLLCLESEVAHFEL